MEAVSTGTSFDALAFAKRTIRHEADALHRIAGGLGEHFMRALDRLEACRGSVIVTGMGKAGLIGQKLSATFCSTGTRSHFLHPAEAVHGDLGRVAKEDCILALSMSGETSELLQLLPSLRNLSSGIVAITSKASSSLAQQSDIVIELGTLTEAGVDGLAPSTSTTAMLAVGDALALTISERKNFRATDFARFHPGGSLGRKLTKVQSVMRPLSDCRVAHHDQSVREAFITVRRSGRRTGAVMIVDDDRRLVGIFTDSDLARLLEREPGPTDEPDSALNSTVRDVMTASPRCIEVGSLMPLAIGILSENQISELPVVDPERRPVGLIDITDVLAWMPRQSNGGNPRDAEIETPRLLQFPAPEIGEQTP